MAMTEDNKNSVGYLSKDYRDMSRLWKLIDDLSGGTIAMRAASTDWLPRETKEEREAYYARLNRSILYGAYKDTVEKIVSKPFSKPVNVQGELPEPLQAIEENTDRMGKDLTEWTRDVFKSAVRYGLTHAIVDFPSLQSEVPDGEEPAERRRISLAEQREQDIRPYFVHVPPPSIIGWRSEQNAAGEHTLTQLRIRDRVTQPSGDYGEDEIDRVTVWTPVDVTIFEKEADKGEDNWVQVSQRPHTFGAIPLVTLNLNPDGYLKATPPLEDLAWLNLVHWQSMSDQRNILRFSRVPMILATGFKAGELEGITIGPNQFFESQNPDAKMEFVEHTGKAIEAGERDLKALEERMTLLGLQPLVQRSGDETATGKAIDEGRTHTAIQAWVRGCENFVHNCYWFASRWIREEINDDEFKIDINNDFGFSTKTAEDVANLIKARLAGEISRETFLRELKRRGFLSEAIDLDMEMQAIEDEMPDVGEEDLPPENPDDDRNRQT